MLAKMFSFTLMAAGLLICSGNTFSSSTTITFVHLIIDSKTHCPIVVKSMKGGGNIQGRIDGTNTDAYLIKAEGVNFTLTLGVEDKVCAISFSSEGAKFLSNCDVIFPGFSYELSSKQDHVDLRLHFDTPPPFFATRMQDDL